MKLFRSIASLLVFAALMLLSLAAVVPVHGLPGACVVFIAVSALGAGLLAPSRERQGMAMATFTTQEILLDVIKAFAKRLPMIKRMGTEFRTSGVVKDKTYTAHVSVLPSVQDYDATTGYANNAAASTSLFQDVDIKVDAHKHVPIKFAHLSLIAQDKNRYERAIANAGYVLAKYVIDSVLAKINTRNFSQSSTYAAADCDYDMLNAVTGALNTQGASDLGRTMLINTAAAGYLGLDARVISKDYAGQQQGGNGYRIFRNVGGFEEVIEYPDFPSNNGAALTGVTAEADDDLCTKAAHGLKTGDAVVFTSGTGFTGLTATTKYYAIYASSSTFKLATSRANAVAGTAINITVDGSDGVFTPTENLAAFGFDMRALSLLTGIPEATDALAAQLGIPQVMAMESVTDPESGITMAAFKWQGAGTADLFWSPTLLWGSRVGCEPAPAAPTTSFAAGTALDYAGHRVITA